MFPKRAFWYGRHRKVCSPSNAKIDIIRTCRASYYPPNDTMEYWDREYLETILGTPDWSYSSATEPSLIMFLNTNIETGSFVHLKA